MNVLFHDVVLQRTARNCAKVRLARASRKLISLLVPVVLVLVGVGVFVVDVKAPYCQWKVVVLLLFYKVAFQNGSLL